MAGYGPTVPTARSYLGRAVQPVLQHASVRVPEGGCGFRRLRPVAALRPNIGNGMESGSKLFIPLRKIRSKAR